ncbi:MAG: NAD-dependent deacylase [Chloroflexi bacterium]|nr:NAD-dependent deacylase [Chloroflexota bacterium]
MSIDKAADLIRNSRNTVALTGAGISTPSGIPDFRSDSNGLWNEHDPMEVASLNAFRINPEKFFRWIRPLLKDMLNAEPNLAHLALAALGDAGYIQTIVTQNIDGLHQSAGSKIVYEIHGSIETLTCVSCYHKYPASQFIESFMIRGEIPNCPDCENTLKPNAILFGEQLPIKTWKSSQNAAHDCDLMIIAGSSLEVMPVAGLPMEAVNSGAKIIILNQSPTYLDERAEIVIHDDIALTLPMIADELIKS